MWATALAPISLSRPFLLNFPGENTPPNLIVRQDSPEAEGTGLDGDSVIQAEVILTVPKTSVVKRLGQFNDVTMRAIDQCVKVSLGL
ncbi:hypothetical protein HKBW3S34_01956 [Candidatus Hakubella thermalkaliphila]|uniref:mRNA interferase MazF n=1 Tax=Candidatus Hakubella thermalkaliphila TaxID=2754717 RepID=A0A6V8PFL1_9ACTN|nr:hypothetical protein HKBW3S34_01956 [Candidatus Hakubella thermalkaliphila]